MRILQPFFALIFISFSSAACAEKIFLANLDAAQEVPTNGSTATGFGRVTLNDTENLITVSVYYSGLTSPGTTVGHIHGPAGVGTNGGVLFNLAPTAGQTSGSVVNRTFVPTAAQVADLKAGLHYFNIHTTTNGGGEIRGQILPSEPYTAAIDGYQELPRNSSAGIGRAVVSLNNAMTQALVTVHWAGVTGPLTVGHIHSNVFGSNGSVVCNLAPPAATAGSVVDFLCPFSAAQITTLKRSGFYVNLHTAASPGGEIRGQIVPPGALSGELNASQEVPPNASTASGFGVVEINATSNVANVNLSWKGLSGPATIGHIHAGALGANGPVICDLAPAALAAGSVDDATCNFTAPQAALVRAGGAYFNLHTAANPGGEIRGQINPLALLRDGFEDPVPAAQAKLHLPIAEGQQLPPATEGSINVQAQCHQK